MIGDQLPNIILIKFLKEFFREDCMLYNKLIELQKKELILIKIFRRLLKTEHKLLPDQCKYVIRILSNDTIIN